MAKIKNNRNKVWENIFNDIGENVLSNIDNKGYYDITADELREYTQILGGPDVRNLVKFDKSAALPEVFKENELLENYINIIPLGTIQGRGYTYRLGRFNAYAPLQIELNQKPEFIEYPQIETISQTFISEMGVSENTYIDLAFTSGMLNKNFNTLDDPLMPVMHGRLKSGDMEFKIGTNPSQLIKTGSSQLEVDATFENKNNVVVIEAKSVPESDFLVRQLYYPFYVIKNRVDTKKVRPTFLLMQEGNFYFNEYTFDEPNNYSTIRLVKQKIFRFVQDNKLTYKKIERLFEESHALPEPNVPFPQANSRAMFVKVLGLIKEAMEEKDGLTNKEISEAIAYSERQGQYYGQLTQYLGVTVKNNSRYVLNQEGEVLLSEFNDNSGRIRLIKLLLKHQPFRILIKWFLKHKRRIEKADESEIIKMLRKDGHFFNVNLESTTFPRRVEAMRSLINTAVVDVLED